MSGGDLLDSVAALEAAYSDVAKRVEDEAWQLSEADVVDVTKRLHALVSKAQGLGVRLVRQVETRAMPGTMGATSLRAFIGGGALRLSPAQAATLARLAKSLHETCIATGAALAEGAVNFEQATRITSMIAGLPSKATPEQRAWA